MRRAGCNGREGGRGKPIEQMTAEQSPERDRTRSISGDASQAEARALRWESAWRTLDQLGCVGGARGRVGER